MAIKFESPGGAAVTAIMEQMRERELLERQRRQDLIAQHRETRETDAEKTNEEIRRETLALTRTQRAQAEREAAAKVGERVANTTTIGAVDDPTAQSIQDFNPSLVDKTLPARTLTMPTAAPGIVNTSPAEEMSGGGGGDAGAGVIPGVSAMGPPAQPPTPAPMMPGVVMPHNMYKGTDDQRERESALNSPYLSEEAKALIRAGVKPTPEMLKGQQTQELFRTDYNKGTVQKYDHGKWINWSGDVPKGAKFLYEPDPQLSAQRAINIELGNQMAGNTNTILPKDVADTVNSATLNLVGRKRGVVRQTLAASWDEDEPDLFRQQIQNVVISNEDPATQRVVEGRRDSLAALTKAEEMLQQLKDAGVDTNLLTGTAEDIVRKLGKSTNPQLAQVGSQLNQTLNEYRRAMTGVQFSQKEAATYQQLFPTYKNDFSVNEALLKQMKSFMQQQQDNFWMQRLGKKGAKLAGVEIEPEIPKDEKPKTAPVNPMDALFNEYAKKHPSKGK
jgi:hypothetical protein